MRWPGLTTLRLITLLLAIVLAWTGRYFVNPDGISYLDLSDDFASGRWESAINGHWSPAYPFVLSIWLRLFGSHSRLEAIGVHALNAILFLLAAVAFELFLRELRRSQLPREGRIIRPWGLDLDTNLGVTCAWSIFLWCTLVLVTIRVVTPDMMVAAIAFAAAAIVLRIREEDASVRSFIALGLLLGVGYLTKSFMFWVGLMLLAMSWATTRRIKSSGSMHALSLGVFLLVAFPMIAALSRQTGTIRIGDSQRFVYALKVNGISKFWIGQPDENGTPRHPMTIVNEKPLTLAFPTATANRTYPLWDDLPYWYDGMRANLNVRDQVKAVERNIKSDFGIAFKILLPVLIVWLLRDRKYPTRYRTLTIVPFAVLAAYALLHSEARLVGPWLAIWIVSVLAGVSLEPKSKNQELARTDLYFITAICAISVFTYVLDQSFSSRTDRGFDALDLQAKVADAVNASGVNPGSRVALIGDESDIHWARLARVQVAIQIPLPNANEYWNMSPDSRAQLDSRIASAGASAMIASWTDAPPGVPGWTKIHGTRYSIHPLH